jgi:hypothetical protein
VLGAGVRVGVKVPATHVLLNPETPATHVGRDDIKMALTELMDEGAVVRGRAKELATMAKMAMAEGGSSDRDLADMLRHVRELEQMKKKGVPVLDVPELGSEMTRS